jgi:predicted outer membrane repeat protein
MIAVRALLWLALALAAAAVDVHVEPAGDWAGHVEAAGAGTVVVFAPGRYEGCSTGGFVLASGVALLGSGGAAATVVDCGGAGRHFLVNGSVDVRIDGLTLTGGGNSTGGGCVLVEGHGGSVVVADSVFSNCSTTAWGGAIAVRGGAALNISRSNFTGNRAGEGGGAIHVAAGATLLVEGPATFVRNSARDGGAVHAVDMSRSGHHRPG